MPDFHMSSSRRAALCCICPGLLAASYALVTFAACAVVLKSAAPTNRQGSARGTAGGYDLSPGKRGDASDDDRGEKQPHGLRWRWKDILWRRKKTGSGEKQQEETRRFWRGLFPCCKKKKKSREKDAAEMEREALPYFLRYGNSIRGRTQKFFAKILQRIKPSPVMHKLYELHAADEEQHAKNADEAAKNGEGVPVDA